MFLTTIEGSKDVGGCTDFKEFSRLSQSLCVRTCERILRAGPSLSPSVSSRCSSDRRGSVSPSIMWSLNVYKVKSHNVKHNKDTTEIVKTKESYNKLLEPT